MHANALVEAEDHREKEGYNQAAGERCFKRARENRASCSGAHRGEQPGKAVAKNTPGRGAANLRQPKTERFENIIAWNGDGRELLFAIPHLQHLFRKETDIDDADNPSGRVHHWKREEFVENKKLACLQDSRVRGDGDHAAHHYLFKPCLEWRDQ